MDIFIGGAGLVLGFSALIFIHELGHYLLAKWNGVRVNVFSLGMGPYVASFTIGETVYVWSLFPIGGYVKMAGQDDMRPALPHDQDPRDYRNKSPGQKAAILAAGAIFNLIFAVAAFTTCYYWGVKMDAPVIGKVVEGSPLSKAQIMTSPTQYANQPLREGDRITMVNGKYMKTMMEVRMEVAGVGPDKEIWINYIRDDRPQLNPVMVKTVHSKELGAASVGLQEYRAPQTFHLGFSTSDYAVMGQDPKADTPAARAGLKKGDRLVSMGGELIKSDGDLIESVKRAEGKEQTLVLQRGREEITTPIAARFDEETKRYLLGIPLPLNIARFVDDIDADSEAAQQGLKRGSYIHEFKILKSDVDIELAFSDDLEPVADKIQYCRIPIDTKSLSGLVHTEQVRAFDMIEAETFFGALSMGWHDVFRYSKTIFTVVRGLLVRDVSHNSIHGGLGIGYTMWRVSVERPVMYYLWFVAFLSVNLGIFQFIPIPLLDGWHLLMIGIEKIKGSPVAPKIQEAFQYAGLFLILALLLLATRNDIMLLFLR